MQNVNKVAIILLILTALLPTSCFGSPRIPAEPEQDDDGRIFLENKSNSTTSILGSRYEHLMPEVISRNEFGPEEIYRVENILGYEIASGEGMTVRFRDITAQVSYIVPENEDELLPLFYSLFDYAGRTEDITPGDDIHAVMLSGNKVYEIISPDCFVGEAIRDTIEVDTLQEIKLTAFNIAGKADLLSERFLTGEELEVESEKIGFELESMVAQLLGFDEGTVGVFFFHPSENVDILEAAERLEEFNGSGEGVLILDDSLVLVDSENVDTIRSVFRFIAIPPPMLYGTNRFKVDLKVALWPDHPLPFYTNWNRTRFEWITGYRLEPIDDSLSIGFPSTVTDEFQGISEFSMTVPTGAVLAQEPEEITPYVEPTDWWPSDSEIALERVSEALSVVEGDGIRAQVEAIRAWVAGNISLEPADYWTRQYVEDVLESGSGSAWSRSDVFVTLTRAAGLPTRLVAGHMYNGEFVVWAQVWLEDEHVWLEVDVGLDQVGVDSFHIPLWGSRNGNMEFAYYEQPVIRRLS